MQNPQGMGEAAKRVPRGRFGRLSRQSTAQILTEQWMVQICMHLDSIRVVRAEINSRMLLSRGAWQHPRVHKRSDADQRLDAGRGAWQHFRVRKTLKQDKQFRISNGTYLKFLTCKEISWYGKWGHEGSNVRQG